MDETEVQVEIACWAQEHPEASTINWTNGNEPWVTLSGKRCTIHVGLGGWTWSIEVPTGYQTEVNPGDGKRKRLWEPLDYNHDTVILQSRDTPFLVSVVDHSNNVLRLSSRNCEGSCVQSDLAKRASKQDPGGGSEQAREDEEVVHLKSTTSVTESNQTLVVSTACYAALEKAETLAEVLDIIHSLVKLCDINQPWGLKMDIVQFTQPNSKSGDDDQRNRSSRHGSEEEVSDDKNGHHRREGSKVDLSEDELGDDDLFATELAIKWSWIEEQVNYARDACRHASARSHTVPTQTLQHRREQESEREVDCRSERSQRWLRDLARISSESPVPHAEADTIMETSPPDASQSESDTEDYTFVSPRDSAALQPAGTLTKKSMLRMMKLDDVTDSMMIALQMPLSNEPDSDSDINSDSSWEIANVDSDDGNWKKPELDEGVRELNRESGILEVGCRGPTRRSRIRARSKQKRAVHNPYATGLNPEVEPLKMSINSSTTDISFREHVSETPFDDQFQWQRDPVEKSVEMQKECRPRPARVQTRAPVPETTDSSLEDGEEPRMLRDLQFCSIGFNPKSFSVQCTIQIGEVMDNHEAATALGLALEHPLCVEIVPDKAQVDSLSWTGAVEVYVSQLSEWHNHVTEEICGLLCLVPYIVQSFFHKQVPELMLAGLTETAKGELFIGVMQTLVRRLRIVNAGGSCCVCTKPGEAPSYLYMIGRSAWPCGNDACRNIYSAWQKVSSVDIQEHQREESSTLHVVESALRDDFPYDDRHALKSALDVYSVNTDDMNYGQMIRALARIEVWNEKDPDTLPSDTLFRF